MGPEFQRRWRWLTHTHSIDRHHREAERRIAESAERAVLEFTGMRDPLLGIDAEGFIARIHRLTPAQELAIVDAVERLRYTTTDQPVDPDEPQGPWEEL